MNDAPPDELIAVLGLAGLCCVLLSGVGLVGLVVWFVRRQAQPAAAPASAPPSPTPAAPTADAPFHLSVLAVSFDAVHRPPVQEALANALGGPDSVTVRVGLVQRLAQALAGLDAHWQHFGYGEKDLLDLTAAQQSYTAALADFRARASQSDTQGPLCVLTLVLCTRGPRLGVDRLDTRAQLRELLADRLRLDEATLLGAEALWDPAAGGLTEPEVLRRYPELHRLAL